MHSTNGSYCDTMNSRPRSPMAQAMASISSSRIEPPSTPFSALQVSTSSSTTWPASTSLLLANGQALARQLESTPARGVEESFTSSKKDHLSLCPAITTNHKRSRGVRFDPAVRGKLFEYTREELQDQWYPQTHFGHFEEQMRADVKLVRSLLKKQEREPLDTLEAAALEATPTRGIEQFLSKRDFIDRTAKQRAVVHGALAAQHRRLSADHTSILSSNLSHEARQRALTNGLFDATEAANCHLTGLV